jgi:hypothetical protein
MYTLHQDVSAGISMKILYLFYFQLYFIKYIFLYPFLLIAGCCSEKSLGIPSGCWAKIQTMQDLYLAAGMHATTQTLSYALL